MDEPLGARRHGVARVGTFRYVVADVFTDVPLAGNQLAVFTDARAIPEEQLQPLACELNLGETVFVSTPTPSPSRTMRTSPGRRTLILDGVQVLNPLPERRLKTLDVVLVERVHVRENPPRHVHIGLDEGLYPRRSLRE